MVTSIIGKTSQTWRKGLVLCFKRIEVYGKSFMQTLFLTADVTDEVT